MHYSAAHENVINDILEEFYRTPEVDSIAIEVRFTKDPKTRAIEFSGASTPM
jgi:hypothetical protein